MLTPHEYTAADQPRPRAMHIPLHQAAVGTLGFVSDDGTWTRWPGLPGETAATYAARMVAAAHGRDPDPIGVVRIPHAPRAA